MTDFTDTNPSRPLAQTVPWVVVGLWALTVYLFARNHGFVEDPNGLPIKIIAAYLLPVAAFAAAYAALAPVRAWVAQLDMGLVVATQTWRVLGFVFFAEWALGNLPALFGIPAGLGDMAVGGAAVAVTLAVARQEAGWQSRVRWLIAAGMLDFAVAFATAVLTSPGRPLQFAGDPTPTALMQGLPLAMIPTFGVPLFTILHLISWFKLRDAR